MWNKVASVFSDRLNERILCSMIIEYMVILHVFVSQVK